MNKNNSSRSSLIQVIALPDPAGRISEDWLQQLALVAGSPIRRWTSARRRQPDWPGILEIARELGRELAEEQGLLFIRSGLLLPRHWQARLCGPLEQDAGLPRLAAGNYADAVNPLAGIEPDFKADSADGWLWLCSEHAATPINDFPVDCIYLPPGSGRSIDEGASALLIDSLFVYDPARSLGAGNSDHPDASSALGPARLRLKSVATEKLSADPPRAGLDERPVTLHISHDWGGGVARWITDIVDADQVGHHLVLASGGHPRGTVHGQVLRLYAAGPGHGLVREMPLGPAISDSVISHQGYRILLERIIERFGVNRILVSSLIGHGLDALEAPVATALVLHDFYPAWPLLDRDPLDWHSEAHGIDLERALEQHGQQLLFRHHQASHWNELKAAWLERIKARPIVLLAPTSEVLRRWQRLVDDPLARAEVIGHGFSGWTSPAQAIVGRPRTDGRLNLVVVGRLSPGKGLNLLDQALADLHPLAHLTLVGCGRHGMRFFGRPGVDIILDYTRDQLPELLAQLRPQAALFLSTVPETWNYTLSETRSLGIPALATRLGSFIERIEPGRNGWLFDPEPEALVALLGSLHADPQQLSAAAGKQADDPDIQSVLKRYWQLVPASAADRPALNSSDPLQAEAARNSSRLAQRDLELGNLVHQLHSVREELKQRAEWALRYERLAGDRTRWGQSLEQDIATHRERIKDLQALLAERSEWARALDEEIAGHRARIRDLQAQLAERTEWARALDEEIAQHRELIEQLQGQVADRTDWARSLEADLTDHRVLIASLEQQIDARTQWARSLERETEKLSAQINGLEQQRQTSALLLEATRTELAGVHNQFAMTAEQLARSEAQLSAAQSELQLIFASRSWRLTRPLRFFHRVLDQARWRGAWNPLRWPRLSGRLIHSLRLHGLRGTLLLSQGSLPLPAERPALPVVNTPVEQPMQEPVVLRRAEEPRASIIIPVYNKLEYTAACLRSIAAEAGQTPFEVIVVDDCSSDATPDFLARCRGLEVVRNAANSGFIASCNAGAARARGEFLVFLNNDTTLTAGWLEALLATFEDFAKVGIVGARLVYPDGRLQEAGGIIFADASGWNYGRGESPDEPQYQFAAEADYVSGACLAIPRDLFAELDGFDRHYAPAYYEDTDLCFRIRQRGLRVMCQPLCTVIHHEGVSSGTDESSGTKRYQAVNREKFLERWQDALTRQPPHLIDSERSDPVRRARFHRARGRALLIDATTPMPDHDSGSVRFTALLELMVEQGWLVSFMPQNLAWEGRYSSTLQSLGVEVLTAPAVSSAENWLRAYGADLDLVLVSRHYVLEPLLKLIREHCPRARLVFDTVDLHFLREQRQAELGGSEAMQAAAARTRRIELGMMNASDLTLVVSPVEQELLADLVPEADVRVLSNIHTVHGRRQDWAQRRDLMFVGGFQHPPNIDAAEWLIDDIFPRIRAELPGVRLHLIGSRMPAALREKARDGVIMHGFVEDLGPYLNGCRLSLAPLRYGAGVKGKVNQAMAWGLPVVATTCAAEGMFLVHGEDVLMADDGAAFAAEVIRAYSDEQLWLQLSEGGLANVEQYFSRAAAGRVVSALLNEARPA